MTFRQQKRAGRLFAATIYGLATLVAAVLTLAMFGSFDSTRRTAQDYAGFKKGVIHKAGSSI